jgi:hypothetical protein
MSESERPSTRTSKSTRAAAPKQIGIFLLFWFCGRIGLAYLPMPAPALFSPYAAILDIVFVFAIFKRDVRLS